MGRAADGRDARTASQPIGSEFRQNTTSTPLSGQRLVWHAHEIKWHIVGVHRYGFHELLREAKSNRDRGAQALGGTRLCQLLQVSILKALALTKAEAAAVKGHSGNNHTIN